MGTGEAGIEWCPGFSIRVLGLSWAAEWETALPGGAGRPGEGTGLGSQAQAGPAAIPERHCLHRLAPSPRTEM